MSERSQGQIIGYKLYKKTLQRKVKLDNEYFLKVIDLVSTEF